MFAHAEQVVEAVVGDDGPATFDENVAGPQIFVYQVLVVQVGHSLRDLERTANARRNRVIRRKMTLEKLTCKAMLMAQSKLALIPDRLM